MFNIQYVNVIFKTFFVFYTGIKKKMLVIKFWILDQVMILHARCIYTG